MGAEGEEMSEEKPLSENIGHYEAGDYHVTSGIWRTRVGYDLFPSYEIGMRRKSTGEFWLLQGDFNHQSVQEVANAIAHLLKCGEFYTPEWCKEHFI